MYAELSKIMVSTFPPVYNQLFPCFLLGVFKVTVNNYLEKPKTRVARNTVRKSSCLVRKQFLILNSKSSFHSSKVIGVNNNCQNYSR